MTASAAAGEQIDPERSGERGERENERERERQVVSGTIQLPSELYWISPTFQNKETNFSQSPSGSQRKNHIIFPRQPRSLNPLPAPLFQRVLHISLSTVEFYDLSYAFFKVKLQKRCIIFFLLHFSKNKKRLAWCVYMYYNLYYVLCIIVLSKHYNDNG